MAKATKRRAHALRKGDNEPGSHGTRPGGQPSGCPVFLFNLQSPIAKQLGPDRAC
jgi:hypothetical protein